MSQATTSPAAPSTVAIYATAVLFFANLIGYVDRKILALLVEPVKDSLGLSDGEIGLMQGAAFVLTFSIAGLFVGRLVDRVNRRNLLIVCVAIWSISAAAGGLAQNGWQLFIARMGVGMGEAALVPAAVSLFADYFPPNRRGKPFGLFSMGVYAGSGLSLVLVGLTLASVTSLSGYLAARGIVIEPWRIIMFATIVPGIVCCALLAKMQEPARELSASQGAAAGNAGRAGIGDWLDRRRFFVPHHLAMALLTLGLLGMSSWLPTILIREHDMAPRDAGLLYGTVYALGGVCSSYVGGFLSDVANRRGGLRGCLMAALFGAATAAFGFLWLWGADSPAQLMVGSVLVFAPSSIALVIGILAVSDVAPARSRGQVTAIHFLVLGIVGTAGGPAIVGYANDVFGSSTVPLSAVLSITGMVAASAAFLLIWLARMRAPVAAAAQSAAS